MAEQTESGQIEVVYAGRRIATDGRLYAVFLAPKDADGPPQDFEPFAWFKTTRTLPAAIGAVYASRGRLRDDGTIETLGVEGCKYVRQSDAPPPRLDLWQIADKAAAVKSARDKQVDKIAKNSSLAARLASLHYAWRMTRPPDRLAFELAVLDAIRRGPK